ncbi:MAG TPA: hypothetical protein VLF79_02790 [Candidatus Saccharimonadales bacterium]|nr:hypothetical protein [Candidatus Saccharimonadales bacterium]
MSELQPGDVINTYQAIRQQLDKAIKGEEYAKDVAIAGVCDQSTPGFFGIAGGGKSTLVRSLVKAIGVDYYSDEVAFIPGQHDLTATRVVGGSSKRRFTSNGDRETEEIEVDSIFKPSSVIAHYEEITGMSPYALRASMSVIASRQLETTDGVVELPNLLTAMVSGNPSSREDGTFRLPDPVASRIPKGAIMGLNPVDDIERIELNLSALDTYESGGENLVVPVTTPEKLRLVGQYLATIAISETQKRHLAEMAAEIAKKLKKDFRMSETDRRLTIHLAQNLRTFAGLRNGGKMGDDKDILDATRSVIAARVGTKPHTEEQLESLDEIAQEVSGIRV